MMGRCSPERYGASKPTCGVLFDDGRRSTVCPHVSLDGGDVVGIGPAARPPDVDVEAPAVPVTVGGRRRRAGRAPVAAIAAGFVLGWSVQALLARGPVEGS